jgi:hypothetical protein
MRKEIKEGRFKRMPQEGDKWLYVNKKNLFSSVRLLFMGIGLALAVPLELF